MDDKAGYEIEISDNIKLLSGAGSDRTSTTTSVLDVQHKDGKQQ